MNIYLIIILSALIGEYILSFVSRYYNLQALDPNLPEEFAGYYDQEKYRKSQEYTRTNSSFGFFTSTFELLLSLAFILLGGFNYLDNFVRGWEFSALVTGLVYFGILFVLHDLITIPLNLYHTFVIEEKYGFNKMTWKLYLIDKLKGYALTIILGGLVLSAVLYFFGAFRELAWLYAWGLVTIFSLIMMPIYINFIAPLFNKFTPLEDGELKSTITEYAQKVQFSLKGVFVMDGSKRSSHSNAYFTGFGKTKRVVLYDTLMEKHSIKEIMGILAHEIGHYKKKHILKGIVIGVIHTGIMFFLMSLFLGNRQLFDAFQMENISVYAGLIFFGILYTPIELLLSILFNILSRHHEFEADDFAATTIGSGESLIEGLKNLSVANLGNLTPHPLTVFISYSHPPVLERIKALRNIHQSE